VLKGSPKGHLACKRLLQPPRGVFLADSAKPAFTYSAVNNNHQWYSRICSRCHIHISARYRQSTGSWRQSVFWQWSSVTEASSLILSTFTLTTYQSTRYVLLSVTT